MENPAPHDHEDGREEIGYLFYMTSPCRLFEKLIRAFLKCLGGHEDHSSSVSPKSDKQEDDPADNNETKMKSTEDDVEHEVVAGVTSIGAPRRKPPTTPVKKGPPGGQINVVSPS